MTLPVNAAALDALIQATNVFDEAVLHGASPAEAHDHAVAFHKEYVAWERLHRLGIDAPKPTGEWTKEAA